MSRKKNKKRKKKYKKKVKKEISKIRFKIPKGIKIKKQLKRNYESGMVKQTF